MKVALAVTGCIGAYKAAVLLRLLQEAGADVRVAMTDAAQRFVAPLTFEALSGHPVVTSMWEDPSPTGEIRHIELAQWCDLLLVAPATANTLAKFAHGICDDFVSTLHISTTAPVMVAPAMNVEMWHHPATQENLERLRARGVHVVAPGSGYLACGMVGEGRLAEPDEIARRAVELLRGPLASTGDLAGERVLVTAGPTREPIDPVRFITNRSSGRMGYAIAEAARARGASVVLVTGPVAIPPPEGVEVVRVETAEEMARATLAHFERATLVIKSAAVADYRPVAVADRKIKKGEGGMTVELERTTDVLAELGRQKGDRVLVGFAAETNDLVANARKKLESKNADLIVANDVTREGAGFDGDTNIAVLVGRDGRADELPMMSKRELADRILDAAAALRSRA
jgi:phosphopantothenoylcysteine decarboxylase/phosphopantothenate--cysteine ligase